MFCFFFLYFFSPYHCVLVVRIKISITRERMEMCAVQAPRRDDPGTISSRRPKKYDRQKSSRRRKPQGRENHTHTIRIDEASGKEEEEKKIITLCAAHRCRRRHRRRAVAVQGECDKRAYIDFNRSLGTESSMGMRFFLSLFPLKRPDGIIVFR